MTRRLDDPRVGWSALAAAIALYGALIFWFARDTTLFLDESQLFTKYDGFNVESLLTPINGHLVFLLRLVHATSFELGGPDMLLVRLVHSIGGAAVACLVFAIARPRLGGAVGLALALLILFLGSAWEITFTQSGITYVWSVALGLGALVALERGDRRADVVACALLVLAVAMFTFGLAFAIGAGVLIALRPQFRKRLWVALTPVAAYLVWVVWIRYLYDAPPDTTLQQLDLGNALKVPGFWADEASSVAGAVTGLDYDFTPDSVFSVFSTSSGYGPIIAGAAIAGLVLGILRGRATPLMWAALASLLAIWTELALGVGEGRSAETVRYVYPGAVLAIVIAAELLRGARARGPVLVAVLAVIALALAGNLARARNGIDYYRSASLSIRAAATALELARDSVAPDYAPDSADFLTASTYLAAVDRIGSPAFSEANLLDQPESVRSAVDAASTAALGVAVTPSPPDQPATSCRTIQPPPTGPSEVALVPPGVQLRSRAPAELGLRRFATTTTVDLGSLPAKQTSNLPLPPDRSQRPWILTIAGSSPVTVCRLPVR